MSQFTGKYVSNHTGDIKICISQEDDIRMTEGRKSSTYDVGGSEFFSEETAGVAAKGLY